MTVPDRVREAALREAKDAAVREAMGRLSPGAVHALRAAAKLRNSTPEEVLREELRDYVASQIPYVDVEGIIRNMAGVFYTAGRRFLRKALAFAETTKPRRGFGAVSAYWGKGKTQSPSMPVLSVSSMGLSPNQIASTAS